LTGTRKRYVADREAGKPRGKRRGAEDYRAWKRAYAELLKRGKGLRGAKRGSKKEA
jgi:hypothetical protein